MQLSLLSLASKYWKKLVIIVALLATSAGSYYYGRQSVSPEIIEKEKIVEKVVEKIVKVEVEKKKEKTNKTTKITEKPDGTKETVITETTETDSTKNSKEVAEKDKTSKKDLMTQTKPNVASKYRIGAFASTSIPAFFDEEEQNRLLYTGTAGMRVLGPFWVEGLYNFSNREVGVGISCEF